MQIGNSACAELCAVLLLLLRIPLIYGDTDRFRTLMAGYIETFFEIVDCLLELQLYLHIPGVKRAVSFSFIR